MSKALKRTLQSLLLLALIVSVSSCSRKDTEAAERGVNTFHEQYNREQYGVIYAEASDEFHKAASQEDLANLLKAVRGKFGTVKSSRLEGWQVKQSPDGNMIILNYETQFEKGSAKERFAWRGTGDQAKLLRYDIKPPEEAPK